MFCSKTGGAIERKRDNTAVKSKGPSSYHKRLSSREIAATKRKRNNVRTVSSRSSSSSRSKTKIVQEKKDEQPREELRAGRNSRGNVSKGKTAVKKTHSSIVSRLRSLLVKHGVSMAATASTVALAGMAIAFLKNSPSAHARSMENPYTVAATHENIQGEEGYPVAQEIQEEKLREYSEIYYLASKWGAGVGVGATALGVSGAAIIMIMDNMENEIRHKIFDQLIDIRKNFFENPKLMQKITVPSLPIVIKHSLSSLIKLCDKFNNQIDNEFRFIPLSTLDYTLFIVRSKKIDKLLSANVTPEFLDINKKDNYTLLCEKKTTMVINKKDTQLEVPSQDEIKYYKEYEICKYDVGSLMDTEKGKSEIEALNVNLKRFTNIDFQKMIDNVFCHNTYNYKDNDSIYKFFDCNFNEKVFLEVKKLIKLNNNYWYYFLINDFNRKTYKSDDQLILTIEPENSQQVPVKEGSPSREVEDLCLDEAYQQPPQYL